MTTSTMTTNHNDDNNNENNTYHHNNNDCNNTHNNPVNDSHYSNLHNKISTTTTYYELDQDDLDAYGDHDQYDDNTCPREEADPPNDEPACNACQTA